MTASLGLAVTSSTGVMSVAIGSVGADTPLAASTIETDRRHAEEITPLIKALAGDAGILLSDIGLLVVDRGPGRFTGLRVGLATVKTLSFALDVSVVGLTSLEVLASVDAVVDHDQFALGGELVTAVVDARRNEVFQQSFKSGCPMGEPVVGLADELAESAVGVIVGDGLDGYPEAYQIDGGEAGGPLSRFPLVGVTVDAATMLRLASERQAMPGSATAPLYLRNPDVNPNVKTRPRV